MSLHLKTHTHTHICTHTHAHKELQKKKGQLMAKKKKKYHGFGHWFLAPILTLTLEGYLSLVSSLVRLELYSKSHTEEHCAPKIYMIFYAITSSQNPLN